MTLREHHEEAKEIVASYNKNKQNGENKMTHEQIIALLQAHKAGKGIQFFAEGEWVDAQFGLAMLIHLVNEFTKIRIKPEASTVAWAIEDFIAHSDCWYRCDFNGNVDSFVGRIQGFGDNLAMILVRDIWYEPNEKDFEWFYCQTPNGEFKPCVKEVIV